MTIHVVQAGECLSLIAQRYGFYEWETIYNAAENAEFRKQRPNPNVIYPGDRIYIPPLQTQIDSGATENRHRFRLKATSHVFRIKLVDDLGEPLVGYPYRLLVDRELVQEGYTPATGLVEIGISLEAEVGILQILGAEYELRFGHLNPAVRITGIQQRLNNLGYDSGPVDGIIGPLTTSAIYRFQKEQEQLRATGELDTETWELLEDLHDGVRNRTLRFEDPKPST